MLLMTKKKRYFFLYNVSVFSRVCPSKEASPFFYILIAHTFTTAGYKNYTEAFSSDKGIGKHKVSARQLQQQDRMKNWGQKTEWKKISARHESDRYCGLLHISHGELPFLRSALQHSAREAPRLNCTKRHGGENWGLWLNLNWQFSYWFIVLKFNIICLFHDYLYTCPEVLML